MMFTNFKRNTALFEKYKLSLTNANIKSLNDIALLSIDDFRKSTESFININDCNALYSLAQDYVTHHENESRRVVVRSNPQLKFAIKQALGSSAPSHTFDGYEAAFGHRADHFVKNSSVASMFSPAAYLTEMYKEARVLHDSLSPLNIDSRRPNLKNITLSQNDMTEEITTLSLSNQILKQHIIQVSGESEDALMQKLANKLHPSTLPFDLPALAIQEALGIQKTSFEQLTNNLAPTIDTAHNHSVEKATKLAFSNSLSPKLYQTLIAPTPSSADEMDTSLAAHFGTFELAKITNASSFSSLVGISLAELNQYLSIPNYYLRANANGAPLQTIDTPIAPKLCGQQYLSKGENSWVGIVNGQLSVISVQLPAALKDRVALLPSQQENNVTIALYSQQPKTYVDLTLDNQHLTDQCDDAVNHFVPVNGYRLIDISLLSGSHNISACYRIDGNMTWYPKQSPSKDNMIVDVSRIDGEVALKLSKLIRYCQTTGLSVETVNTLIALTCPSASDMQIKDETLSLSALVLKYQKQYKVSEENALVLAGAPLSAYSQEGSRCHFDRIFNSIEINTATFTTDSSNNSLNLNPDDTVFKGERATLKQALKLKDKDGNSLSALASIAAGDCRLWARSLENMSLLYRISLWSEVSNLGPIYLEQILKVVGKQASLFHATPAVLAEYLSALDNLTRWMDGQQLSADVFLLMLSKHYPSTMSDDIESFIHDIQAAIWQDNGSGNHSHAPNHNAQLKEVISSVIASKLHLSTPYTAELLLGWLEQIAPMQALPITSIEDYCACITHYINFKDDDSATKIAVLTQQMANLALIVNFWALSELEMELIVDHSTVGLGQAKLPLTYGGLRSISELSTLKKGLGKAGNKVLSALKLGNLTSNLFAEYAQIPVDEMTKVATYIGAKNFTVSQATNALLWHYSAQKLGGLNVKTLKTLITLSTTQRVMKEWETCVHELVSSLSKTRRKDYDGIIAEKMATALCNEFMSSVAPQLQAYNIPLNDREDIYTFLLIDNLVSNEVKTTHVAEAVSSLQLYINRVIQGLEEDINPLILARPFFKEWQMYNNHYSSWAGSAKLVYYPENYVDPTIRYNTSTLQQQLINGISGGPVNNDTLQKAVLGYLDGFEKVATLKVISGYMHSSSLNHGTSYFVGRTPNAPYSYFYRTLDTSKTDGFGGFNAEAWGDWKAMNAVASDAINAQVRLVSFNNRLYCAWLATKTAKNPSKTPGSEPSITTYCLKLASLNMSGHWVNVGDFPLGLTHPNVHNNHLFLSYNQKNDAIVAMFYNPESHNSADCIGGFIGKDQVLKTISDSNQWQLLQDQFSHNLNTSQMENKVIRMISSTSYHTQITKAVITNTDPSGLAVKNCELNACINEIPTPQQVTRTFNTEFSADSTTLNTGWGRFGESKPLTKGISLRLDNISFDRSKMEVSYDAIIDIADNLPELTLVVEFVKDFKDPDKTKSITIPTGKAYTYTARGIKGKFIPRAQYTDQDILKDPYFANYKYFVNSGIFAIISDNKSQKIFDWLVPILGLKPDQWSAEFNGEDIALVDGNNTFNRSVVKNIPPFGLRENLPFTIKKNDEEVYRAEFTANTQVNDNMSPNPVDYYRIFDAGVDSASYLMATNNPRRTRLNTLLADTLISQASRGVDSVFTWETQQLPEPKMGEGTYVELTFSPYDPAIHGTSRTVQIYNTWVYGDKSFPIAEFTLGDLPHTERLFLPRVWNASGDIDHLYVKACYQNGMTKAIMFDRTDKSDPNGWSLVQNGSFSGLSKARALKCNSEPMDFNGANSLYFWELFFYTPMIVVDCMLKQHAFDQAEEWLKYVFNPAGYMEGSLNTLHQTNRRWNVRPLQEDSSWNTQSIKTKDPDVAAQNDPLHYKVFVFMKLLDIVMTRGDSAYRKLTREDMAEAKMWYVLALKFLGSEPKFPTDGAWDNPSLYQASHISVSKQDMASKVALVAGDLLKLGNMPNNNTNVKFLPTTNEKLMGYWKTIEQRLFNLRHNLSISGQRITLPMFEKPADPKALLLAGVAGQGGGTPLPPASISILRFPDVWKEARENVDRLMQFGQKMLSAMESADSKLLERMIKENLEAVSKCEKLALEAEISALNQEMLKIVEDKSDIEKSKNKSHMHFGKSESSVYESEINDTFDPNKIIGSTIHEFSTMQFWENEKIRFKDKIENGLNIGETCAMTSSIDGAVIATLGKPSIITGTGILRSLPTIFGLSNGGQDNAAAPETVKATLNMVLDLNKRYGEISEKYAEYERREGEWELEKDKAEFQKAQEKQELNVLQERKEAAIARLAAQNSIIDGYAQEIKQLSEQNSNERLYQWMKGKLRGLYYQYFDLVIGHCLKAQLSYQWETKDPQQFVRPGAWDANHFGLLSGETLMLNLKQMESAYLSWNQAALEVRRIISLKKELHGSLDAGSLNNEIVHVLSGQSSSITPHTIELDNNAALVISVDLKALNIKEDYPTSLVKGNVRRIKQVKITLPELLNPYEDIQALLSYSGNGQGINQSLTSAAISQGIEDNGRFRGNYAMNFGSDVYLPFEGLPIDGDGSAKLVFTIPNAGDGKRQHELIKKLTDVILHIDYTIR